jgi:hypothetical protein
MTDAKLLTLNSEWLWSFCIRSRDRFICQLHGKDHLQCAGGLQAMHLVTRGVKGIKYELTNGKTGCQAHHVFYTYNPHLWIALCQKLWPSEWVYVTNKKWQEPAFDLDREAIFEELLQECQQYKREFFEFLPKIQEIETWAEKRK